ncbi:MAG: hypothetical protein AAFZ15_31085 [Bacteroidota bacterium]
MKFLKQLSLLALLAVLALTACQKEEIFETVTEVPEIEPIETHVNGLLARSAPSAGGLDLGCVSIDYPFGLLLLDSSIIEIASEDDFLIAFNNEDNLPLDFVYPITVTDEDGVSSTAENAEELAELFVDCIPDTGWDDNYNDWFFPAWIISYETSCYQLTYPITLLDIDSVAITAADEAELTALLSNGNIYSFAFPLELEDEDGNAVTAESAEDLFDLLADCSPDPGPGGYGIGTFGCYELGYPATLLLIDGTTVTVNDDDEFAAVFVSGEWADFGYPLTLIDEDGNEIVVNDNEELHEALFDCSGFGGGGPTFEVGDFNCYNAVYPFSVNETTTGTVVTFNNSDEWNEYLLNLLNSGGAIGPIEFVFPLTLVHVETGEEVVVNNQDEFDEAVLACYENPGGGSSGGSGGGGGNPNIEFGDFLCYDFVYPFTVNELTTGVTATFNDSDEWNDFLINSQNGQTHIEFVYPISLTKVETGDEITVADEEELFLALEECW